MEILNYSSVGEKIYKYTHKSGLRVYMAQKKGFSKKAAYFATHFGSINTGFTLDGRRISVPDGTAHFLEHKMFEMPDNTNVFDMFGKFGASANAFTSFNITSYYFWCTQNFKQNLKTLVGFVQTPHFTPENVAKEQGIIGQEIRMYNDDPNWNCYFNMLCGLYKNHPITIDTAGTVESIAEITDKTLYDCYNTFYHPSNMTLCLVGDFDVDEMKEYVDSIVEDVKALPPVENIMPDEPNEISKPLNIKNMSVSQPIYCIGFKNSNPSMEAQEKLKFDIALDMFLGKSSKLYNDLYKDGLISPNFGFEYETDSTYGFSVISDEGIDGEVVAKRIVDASEGFEPTEDELEISKRRLFGNGLRALNDPDNYALELSRSLTVGGDALDAFNHFDKITVDDIKKVFETHLTKNNMAVSIIK